MKEITNPKIEELRKKADELQAKSIEIYNKIKREKQKLIKLDYNGKYIKYVDDFDSTPIYMKVAFVREDTKFSDRFDFSYEFVGYGFWGEFTGYDDATEFDWSYWFSFNIHANESCWDEQIAKIQEITKEEFDEAFEEMLKSVKEYHYKIK